MWSWGAVHDSIQYFGSQHRPFFSEIYLCQKFVRITDSSFGNNCLCHILQSFAGAFKSLQLMTVNSTNISWGPNQTIQLLSLLTQKSFYKCLQMILRTWLYRIIMWKIYRIRLNVDIWLKMAFVLHFCQLAKVEGSKGASWVSPSTCCALLRHSEPYSSAAKRS